MIDREKLNQLSKEEKEEIYRMVWYEHVCEDIQQQAEWLNIELSDEQINEIARLYVYEGEYDDYLNYWQNLDHLIEKVCYG